MRLDTLKKKAKKLGNRLRNCLHSSMAARTLPKRRTFNVLSVEAGGTDDLANVMETDQWPTNLGSKRDWPSKPSPVLSPPGRLILTIDSGLGDEHNI
jgi:choline dehydrogenase